MSKKDLKVIFSKAICDDLAKSGLTPLDALTLGWHEDANGNLAIPYGNGNGLVRTRLTTPKKISRRGKVTYQRYSQPRGTAPELYLPTIGGIDWDTVKADASITLVVTEGEKKAAAACKAGIICIGIGGVDCWCSKGGIPLPQWDEFDLKGLEVVIAFDNDVITKLPVRRAMHRLATALMARGATVSMVEFPATADEKVGLDDFLVANGLGGGNLTAAKEAFEALSRIAFTKLPSEETIVRELNETFAVVNVKGKALILEELVDQDGLRAHQFLQLSDFKIRMGNRFAANAEGRPIPAAPVWLRSPLRREFSEVVFEPGGAPPDKYNLWQGLSVEPIPGDCSLLLDHIENCICDGDQAAFNYLIAWCADMIQNPASLPEVAIALRGEQGVGKGMFAQALLRLAAPHSVPVTLGSQITGRFNSIIEAKLLIFMDEAHWGGEKKAEGVLKGLITESKLVIEQKGKEPYPISNYARILMASNNDWMVPADHDARRYLVLDVSNKHRVDTAYFKALSEHIDGGGLQAFAHYLLNYDLSGVNLRKPPMTKALLDQKIESMDSATRFIHEMLESGENGMDRRWSPAVPVSQVHQRYAEANKDLYGKTESQNKFGRVLAKVLGIEQNRETVGRDRVRVWLFPSLSECRQRFDRRMGGALDWGDNDAEQPGTVVPMRRHRKYDQ